jgi:hypothetical protein
MKKKKENKMTEWKEYRKKVTTEMRPFVLGESLSKISVSREDMPVEEGGMVARNKYNHDDQWYVAKKYFNDNYVVAE